MCVSFEFILACYKSVLQELLQHCLLLILIHEACKIVTTRLNISAAKCLMIRHYGIFIVCVYKSSPALVRLKCK